MQHKHNKKDPFRAGIDRTSTKYLLILGILLIAPVIQATAQVSIGGNAGFQLPLSITTTTADTTFNVSPISKIDLALSAGAFFFELDIVGSVEVSPDTIEGAMRNFRLVAAPVDFATVTMGRFLYTPGSAEVFSNLSFFERIDYSLLISHEASGYRYPVTMIQSAFFYRDFYFKQTIAPVYESLILPDPDSRWFPDNAIPEELPWPFPPYAKTFRQAYYAEETMQETGFNAMSYGFELGATLGVLDLSAMYYRGWDTSPLYTGQVIFPVDATTRFDIELMPVPRRIDAIGLSGVSTYDGFRLWVDAAYTFQKSFLTGEFRQLKTEVGTAPMLGLTAGLSYEAPFAGLHGLVEYHDTFIFSSADSELQRSLLGRALAFVVGAGLFDFRLFPEVIAILSTEDWSAVVLGAIRFSPSSEIEIKMTLPWFFGGSASELGQFDGPCLLSAELQVFF